MAELPNLAHLDYASRINRVVDYIVAHLDSRHSLTELAEIACFSSYHFHRVFKSAVGETLNAFTKRVRLERALYLLSHTRSSIQEVARTCGFTSSSDFSRSFRDHYGTAPRTFDLAAYRKLNRQALKSNYSAAVPGDTLERLPDGTNPDGFTVRFRTYPARRIVYRRVWHPFEGAPVIPVAEELIAWAEKHGVADGEWLGYMWEDPEITRLEDCRYDVGVCVPPDYGAPYGVAVLDLPPMRVAEVEASGPIEVEQRALDWLYGSWLPSSNYVPDHQPCFERWHGLPFEHGANHFALSVQLAIRRS